MSADIRFAHASRYEPVIAEDMEAAKQEVAKLSPGAVIVSAMKFRGGTAREKFLEP